MAQSGQSDKLQQAISLLTSIRSTTSTGATVDEASGSSAGQPRLLGVRERVAGSCSRALDAVRSIRSCLGRSAEGSDAASEQRANFSPYSRQKKSTAVTKRQSWTTKIVCLSSKDASRVPCGVVEREALVQAGLGEKKIIIPDITATSQEFQEIITSAFPKLSGCGGYDLLRCIPNTKELEVISPAVSQSSKLLKSVVASGRVYIPPIQRNLKLDIDDELISSLKAKEKCIHCGRQVALQDLRKHVQACKFERLKTTLDSSSGSLSDYSSDSETEMKTSAPSPPKHIIIPSDDDASSSKESDITETERVMVDHALKVSSPPCENQSTNSENQSPQQNPETLCDIVKMLSRNVKQEEIVIPLRRAHVLEDALRSVRRRNFPLTHTVKVEFLGEVGDGGGLRREFWTLLSRDIKSSLFEGGDDRCVLRHDAVGLQSNKFYYIGQLMAMSVVQGGTGFPYMAPPMYKYLCGADITKVEVNVEDVPNYEVRHLLKQIEDASDDKTLQTVCLQGVDLTLEAGYTKLITAITLAAKSEVMNTLMLHYTLFRSKAVLDQLKSGLCAMGVLDAMAKHPDILETLFVCGRQPLTTDIIRKLLKNIHFSDAGTTERSKEEGIYMLFIDFLHDCEEDGEVTLGQVLSFFTGTEYPPPMGFDEVPGIQFALHSLWLQLVLFN